MPAQGPDGTEEDSLLRTNDTPNESGWAFQWKKSCCFVGIIGLVVLAVKVLLILFTTENFQNYFLETLNWCKTNPQLGSLIYSLIFSLGAVLCLPEIGLAAVSGYLFPYYLAFITTWIGGLLGACLSFFLGRYLCRDLVRKILLKKNNFLKELDLVIKKGRWAGILLLRIPYVPFVLVNYGLSTTSISFEDYFWPTVVGIMPGSALFTYVGMSLKSLKGVFDGTESLGPIPVVISVCGIFVFVLIFLYAASLAKKNLKKDNSLDPAVEDHPLLLDSH